MYISYYTIDVYLLYFILYIMETRAIGIDDRKKSIELNIPKLNN